MSRARPIPYLGLDLKKAAELMCMTPETFLGYVRSGHLPPPVRIDKDERWNPNDLQALMRGERAYSEDLE